MRFRKHKEAAQTASRGLLLLFAGVLVVLVLAVNGVLALIYRLSLPWMEGFPNLFFETNTALVLLFVLGGCWFETLRLREGGPHVARLAGGRPIDAPHGHASDLYEKRARNVVDEVAIAANLKPPPVYVLQREQAINAFAAGWSAEDAVIALTRGAIERLTRDELQGVVAHEFSHIQHGDMRLNMRLIGLVWGLQMIYNFGQSLAEPDEHGRRGLGTLFGLGLMGVGSLGWIAGRMLKAAVSRQREFLADASAVQFTRSVDGLGGALRKIADQAAQGKDAIAHPQAESLSHLFFVSALRWSVFATHPPLDERIRRIYGFDVVPLAAKVLEEEDDDAPDTQPMHVGTLALAGNDTAGRTGALAWVESTLPEMLRPEIDLPVLEQALPEAASNDVTWQAAFENSAEVEREALARIRRWHGPGERRAAILGLLLTPGEPHERKAWRLETAGLSVAEEVYAELQKLTHASRAPVWELMLRRSARAPLAERRALVEAARRVMKSDGHVSPLDRLRWLGMRHLLSGAAQVKPPSGPDNDIAHLSKHVAVVTAFLARIIDDESRVGGAASPVPGESTWAQAVWMSALPGVQLPAHWPTPDGDELVQGWSGLARLSAMQRPVLLRCWVEAAVQLSPQGGLDEAQADALRLAALLLDCPSPKILADRYIEVE